MKSINFSLSISAQQYQQYYAGQAKFVKVVASDGRSLRFPAAVLQSLVSHDGIHGHFRLEFDARNKFKCIVRL